MPGSHLKEGRSRFAWEVLRFILGWALVVSLVVTLFWLLQEVLPALVGDSTTTTEAVATTTTVVDTTPGPDTTTTTTTTTTTAPQATTTTVPAAPTTTLAPVRPPEEVVVLVLNSTPRVGIAATVAADLAAIGYEVVPPANALPQRDVTVILHTDGYGLEAGELIAHVDPLAEVRPDDEGRTTARVPIVVILGDSFDP